MPFPVPTPLNHALSVRLGELVVAVVDDAVKVTLPAFEILNTNMLEEEAASKRSAVEPGVP